MTGRARPRRGALRVYLGAAPGVGKTYAMLSEGARRRARGADVVVGLVETHGRVHTATLLDGVEVVPRRRVEHRGTVVEEMDLDALLRRAPRVALVDELAHSNVVGCRNAKRWQDVEELLDAGIDVVTTVNIQHLESLNDVVEVITGVTQRETVPDDVVRRADQVELVDMSPQALRRRLAHGNVYAGDRVDAALTSYFRVGNLTALRELALLWTADRVDAALERYRTEEGIVHPWPTRERVVVGLTGRAEGEVLLRRAARIAQRASGGELLAVHASRTDGLTTSSLSQLARLRQLTADLGGTFHSVVGEDVADVVLDFARGVNATQIVLGASTRGRTRSVVSPGIAADVVAGSGDIDVHIVSHPGDATRRSRVRPTSSPLGRRRTVAGWALALVGVPSLTGALHLTRDLHGLPTVLLLFLALTVGVSLIGGLRPALVTALGGGVLANVLFTEPLFTWMIADGQNALALVVLVAVAIGVSTVVDLAARRTRQAAQARAEADLLSMLAGSVLDGQAGVPALLERLRETFGLDAVALLERAGDEEPWSVLGCSGTHPPSRPDDAEITVPIRAGLCLVATGPHPAASAMRVLTTVANQADAVVERDRLRAAARAAHREQERTVIRTALLAAVSHDLRTPLAGIKASASALRSEVDFSPADRAELLATIEESADRLQGLVDNLLDMSRLDSGVVRPLLEAVAVEEVLPGAVLGVPATSVALRLPVALPFVRADPGLFERALANVIENGVRHSPAGVPVDVLAEVVADDRVVVHVVDHGPGVPDERKETMFEAFQRWGDAPAGEGVGLGLAVARGFMEAQDGTLEVTDTPAGGLTFVLTLPVAVEAGAGASAGVSG